jgi:hypothetical protein
MGKQSIVQQGVPDLGAPKLSYSLVEYADCDPPIYAIGIRINGEPRGMVTDGGGVEVTSPSKQFLREHCLRKGISPHVEGATTA